MLHPTSLAAAGPVPLVFLLFAGIVLIVLAVTRWKVHPFLALLAAALALGFAAGLPADAVLAALTGGFGRTVGAIGIVIACGSIIGSLLERSGGALLLADAVLRLLGKGRSLLAMSFTGAFVSIPVFCDSGYVVLSPLNRSLARRSGQSLAGFAVALSMGLYATHVFVPPTPGPIAAAGEYSADLGTVIGLGLLAALPVILATFLYARSIGRKIYISPEAPAAEPDAEGEQPPQLTSTAAAVAPILIPVLLIAAGSIAALPGRPAGTGVVADVMRVAGNPNVALLLGVFVAWLVTRRFGAERFSAWSSEGIKTAGTIILITGAGGALGAVLRETPLAQVVGPALASLDLGFFRLALPFLVAAAIKTALGSSTVAIITTASLFAPLLPALGLTAGAGPALAVLATGAGSMTVSHVNDSYFWVVSQMSGMNLAQAFRLITVASAIAGATGLAAVLLLGWILL